MRTSPGAPIRAPNLQNWRAKRSPPSNWSRIAPPPSPTHTVRAFAQALEELEQDGGIAARRARHCENHRILVDAMERPQFRPLLPAAYQSPIITAFHPPDHPGYQFKRFYDALKQHGFIVYPGKVTDIDTFRIGNIGHILPQDMERLLAAVQEAVCWT